MLGEWIVGLMLAGWAKIEHADDGVPLAFMVYAAALNVSMLLGLFLLRVVGYRMVTVDRDKHLRRAAVCQLAEGPRGV